MGKVNYVLFCIIKKVFFFNCRSWNLLGKCNNDCTYPRAFWSSRPSRALFSDVTLINEKQIKNQTFRNTESLATGIRRSLITLGNIQLNPASSNPLSVISHSRYFELKTIGFALHLFTICYFEVFFASPESLKQRGSTILHQRVTGKTGS